MSHPARRPAPACGRRDFLKDANGMKIDTPQIIEHLDHLNRVLDSDALADMSARRRIAKGSMLDAWRAFSEADKTAWELGQRFRASGQRGDFDVWSEVAKSAEKLRNEYIKARSIFDRLDRTFEAARANAEDA